MDNPLLAPDLLEAGNFILTPHVAWSSREAMQTLADQLIDNIEAFAAGEAQPGGLKRRAGAAPIGDDGAPSRRGRDLHSRPPRRSASSGIAAGPCMTQAGTLWMQAALPASITRRATGMPACRSIAVTMVCVPAYYAVAY